MNENLTNLFQNNEFLIISELKCIPNLRKIRKSTFLDNYRLLDENNVELINTLILNECYHLFFNDYKYVAVIDTDEVILPKLLHAFDLSKSMDYVNSIDFDIDINSKTGNKNETFELNRSLFLRKCNIYESKRLIIENFLNDLNSKSHSSFAKSFSFLPVFHIKNEIASSIFHELNKTITNLTKNSKRNRKKLFINHEQIEINVDFKNYFLHSFNHSKLESREITFTISNDHEYEYTKKLIALYYKQIQPFLNSNKENLNSIVKDFDRFFFISESESDPSRKSFKSIHNASHVFDFNINHADKYILGNQVDSIGMRNSNYDFLEYEGFYKIPPKFAYVSHFGSIFGARISKISVSKLHFDFNYFSCYFLPIFKRLSH
jgi:hypothetical protein